MGGVGEEGDVLASASLKAFAASSWKIKTHFIDQVNSTFNEDFDNTRKGQQKHLDFIDS